MQSANHSTSAPDRFYQFNNQPLSLIKKIVATSGNEKQDISVYCKAVE